MAEGDRRRRVRQRSGTCPRARAGPVARGADHEAHAPLPRDRASHRGRRLPPVHDLRIPAQAHPAGLARAGEAPVGAELKSTHTIHAYYSSRFHEISCCAFIPASTLAL